MLSSMEIGCSPARKFAPRFSTLALLAVFSWFGLPMLAQDTPISNSEISQDKQASSELTSHDEPTTFKVSAKLVLVRVVVRDSSGHAVGNLRQEDFEVFDKGKPQIVSQFEVEQPGTVLAKARQISQADSSNSQSPSTDKREDGPVSVPERFVAYMFDDIHLEFGDLVRVREAALRHFSTLRTTDRAAVVTTSGLVALDFTDDRAKLRETLLRIEPHPVRSSSPDCPDISYYQADLIVNKNDLLATQLAAQEATTCLPVGSAPGSRQPVALGDPAALVNAASRAAIATGEQESKVSLVTLKQTVNSISRMPGQRSIVLVSPGFIAPQLEFDYNQIIDRAVHAQVAINTLDARGLYVVMPFGDASHTAQTPPPPGKTLIETAAASANDDLLSVFADSTGGVFFHNNNDFDEGFRRVAEAPEYSYVLGFAPQNLKLDGSYHILKVKLKNPQKLSLQARRGYYAPKTSADPGEQAKQEIEDAMFSQEELHNLPVKLHTQFFKSGDADAKLVVLAHVDVKQLHFNKSEGRNNNVLTCVSAVFNRNGNLVQGTEKTVTMHLKDDTLEHKLASGITLKTSFDVKPGNYLVRLVVRDSEGQLMSAENGAVEIR
ncbi:MAG: VWA domain-containing protein [Candidatus Sulfotelmatobacter sp.]